MKNTTHTTLKHLTMASLLFGSSMAFAYDDMDFDYTDDGDYAYSNDTWFGYDNNIEPEYINVNKKTPDDNKQATSDDVEIDLISGSEYVTNDASVQTALLEK